jgi:Flp pilus assembly protein TadG
MRSNVQAMRALIQARESGQVIVIFAVFVIVLLLLSGSAYDYASIVVDDARLQNAVDSAALAGSNAMSSNVTLPSQTQMAIAQSTVTTYLAANGVGTATPGTNVLITFPTSTPAAGVATPATPILENIGLTVTRDHKTAFWPLAKINQVSMSGGGGAHAARGMVDVMLALDTTYSQVATGTFPSIQSATAAFIESMNPSTSDTRGPQVGISRFGGIKCRYDPLDPGNTYIAPCQDDWNVLTPLTNNKPALLAVANGGAACPGTAGSNGGCPLRHLFWTAANAWGNGNPAVGFSTTNGGWPAAYAGVGWAGTPENWPAATGTKLPNAITSMGINPATPYTLSSFLSSYAWATANGGRNDRTPGGTGYARKVLVIMTDGQDEVWPSQNIPSEDAATYDSHLLSLANLLKAGPTGDGSDGVEIYVVGYFCTPYSPGSNGIPGKWCQSALAATAVPHDCPGAWPAAHTPSAIDTLLYQISSSTANTCDHYLPLGKGENLLPQLFTQLAGRISRGQLTQ